MLSSGLRRHRIRVERRAAVEDEYGNTREDWFVMLDRWAAVKPPIRGVERPDAGEVASVENWSVTVLRDADTKGILTEDRVIFSAGPHVGREGAVVAGRATDDGREMQIDVIMGAPT